MPSDPELGVLLRGVVRRLNGFAKMVLPAKVIPQCSGFDAAKKLWRALTLVLHPDKGGNAVMFAQMNGAWDTFQTAKKAHEDSSKTPDPAAAPQGGPHGGPPTATPRGFRVRGEAFLLTWNGASWQAEIPLQLLDRLEAFRTHAGPRSPHTASEPRISAPDREKHMLSLIGTTYPGPRS